MALGQDQDRSLRVHEERYELELVVHICRFDDIRMLDLTAKLEEGRHGD